MFQPGEDEAKIRMLGFKPEDYPDEIVDVWPENARAVDLFQRVSNQWRMGMNGPVSLDMNVIIALAQRMGLNDEEFIEIIDDVQIMETTALATMRENANEK